MIHCWTYWLVSLAVAELIAYALPIHKNPGMELNQQSVEEGFSEDEEQNSLTIDGDYHSEDNNSRDVDPLLSTITNDTKPSYLGINILSLILSTIVATVTILIFCR